MDSYVFFIKNLPSDLIPLINSFVNPETDYYLTELKKKVKKFCNNGFYRITNEGIKQNHSYFYREGKEQILEKEFNDTFDFNDKIGKIINIKNAIKKLYIPSMRKCAIAINKDIEMLLALLLLNAKYKIINSNIFFYCKKIKY